MTPCRRERRVRRGLGRDDLSALQHAAYYYKVALPDRRQRHCTYVAAHGDHRRRVSAAGFATTAQLGADPKGVFVATYNAAGTLTAESFHLIVVCPPAT